MIDYSGTVLFIGGPRDGQTEVVQDWRADQVIRIPDPVLYGKFTDLTGHPATYHYYADRLYVRKTIAFFGQAITVHVWQDLPDERIEASLGAHLLSDVAKSVIHDSKWDV